MNFWQAIAFAIGLYAASQNPLPDAPLPPNENPFTTDDSWDCYSQDDEYICETEHTPCHYKHSVRECKHVLRWKVKRAR